MDLRPFGVRTDKGRPLSRSAHQLPARLTSPRNLARLPVRRACTSVSSPLQPWNTQLLRLVDLPTAKSLAVT